MRLTPVRTLVPALLVLAVAVTGCSGDGNGDSGGDSSGSVAGAPAPAQAEGNVADSDRSGFEVRDGADLLSTAEQPDPADPQQALIKKGNVALRADDVGKTQFEVQGVVDAHGGSVTEEKTTTDDAGAPAYTRMVLRIPAADFDDAMTELKTIEGAELESANTSEEDVTTKLIDTQTRIKVQRRSIERITVLFDRAQSIRDIMAIEAQLSRRQADLDSLERQAAYLQSQTSLSTIVVSVDQIPEKKATKPKDDDTGFLAGLSAGWHGLATFAVAMATLVGALLPWMVLLLVLGVPTLLVLRATRRRRPHPAPEPSEG
ncbi:DUF4349 domain-containing protein [Nocardioides sp. T2.26MG-1]|uniref:DUF4349 domain-containing protein n=1 Tax=Nocardioides sp. T2.26MG-1 TaxID=3041166 RepID=UPI002477C58E|nr:DUF4349 domain-containing protein [Nocardioides sp. T2.26MG-1]CAI9415718.1 hypothetical protein HIDPHFAB_02593 [Nocardioides sp. T2.26MG-1]